ncbi:MAG: hypothetical protein ACYDC8_17215 [Gammaproteobacteria bacterium]
MIEQPPLLILEGVNNGSALLEISYSGVAGEHADEIERLNAIVRTLAEVAAYGGFWGGGSPVSRSVIELRPTIGDEANGIVQSLHVAQLDPLVFQCLRQMVSLIRKDDINIDKIRVVDCGALNPTQVSLGWPDEDNEAQAYPRLSPELERALLFESADFAKSRRFLVELDRSITPVALVEFERWVLAWYRLLECSAFSMPVGLPQETDSLVGQVSQFDDVTVEVTVDRFLASEQAWLVLANMTGAFWRSHANILRIVID